MADFPMQIDVGLRERVASVETDIRAIKQTALDHVAMDARDHAGLHEALSRSEAKIEKKIDGLADTLDTIRMTLAEQHGGWKAIARLVGGGALGGGTLVGVLELFGSGLL